MQNSYKSCIKIHGKPILPPLITPDRKLELQNDKRKAIIIENQLKCQKEIRSLISDCNINRTLEHALAFGCDNSDKVSLNASGDNSESDHKSPPETDVPSLSSKNQKTSRFTCNIFDVSQYSDDGVIVFQELNLETSQTPLLQEPLQVSEITEVESKPKLLRSNSYTLESPSPVLLEHLKRQTQSLHQTPLDRRQIELFDPLMQSPEGQHQDEVFLPSSPCTDTFNALDTSTPLLIDFESEAIDTDPLLNSEQALLVSEYPLMDKGSLFIKPGQKQKLTKEERARREKWAALVLTAAAKGYLVRRLKRTERVKNLIQTIGDALTCAVSLHTENSENIQPSDVELHRRLIQQVLAACHEFYEVFFGLTTKEQMSMIAIDRQRVQEKLKRPKSTSSLALDSGKNTPKLQRRSFTARQRKTLTPSFAA